MRPRTWPNSCVSHFGSVNRHRPTESRLKRRPVAASVSREQVPMLESQAARERKGGQRDRETETERQRERDRVRERDGERKIYE